MHEYTEITDEWFSCRLWLLSSTNTSPQTRRLPPRPPRGTLVSVRDARVACVCLWDEYMHARKAKNKTSQISLFRTVTCKINGDCSDGVPVVNWYKSAVQNRWKFPFFLASRSMLSDVFYACLIQWAHKCAQWACTCRQYTCMRVSCVYVWQTVVDMCIYANVVVHVYTYCTRILNRARAWAWGHADIMCMHAYTRHTYPTERERELEGMLCAAEHKYQDLLGRSADEYTKNRIVQVLQSLKLFAFWVGQKRNISELISPSRTFGFHMK